MTIERDEVLAELRELLTQWDSASETTKLDVLARIEEAGYRAFRRVPSFPHTWVADYPGGRPALRWSQEQQDLPCYCRDCRTPYDRELLNEECWARNPSFRTRLRRVLCSD